MDRVQLVSIASSGGLLLLVLELVRRRRLVEEYALLWILCGVALLTLSIWRGILHAAARTLGVFYPPSVLLMAVVAAAFLLLLWFSLALSRQRRAIERLTEETAVLAVELRELRRGAVAPGDVIAHTPQDRPQPPGQ
jgi:hypothetical protein